MSNILMHYGVRGMKWRRRKTPPVNQQNLNPRFSWRRLEYENSAGYHHGSYHGIYRDYYNRPGNAVNISPNADANQKNGKKSKVKELARRKVTNVVSSNAGVKVRGLAGSKSSMRGQKKIRRSGILSKSIASLAAM